MSYLVMRLKLCLASLVAAQPPHKNRNQLHLGVALLLLRDGEVLRLHKLFAVRLIYYSIKICFHTINWNAGHSLVAVASAGHTAFSWLHVPILRLQSPIYSENKVTTVQKRFERAREAQSDVPTEGGGSRSWAIYSSGCLPLSVTVSFPYLYLNSRTRNLLISQCVSN
jgi:hypothetical protein